jgi:hypothetical protein
MENAAKSFGGAIAIENGAGREVTASTAVRVVGSPNISSEPARSTGPAI